MCYNGMGDGMLNESLLDKKKRYLVGVSGGVDSMALLDMLVKKGYQVRVVHYNYHLRNDSDLDEKLVFSYCQKHQIPFYVKQGCVDEYQGNKVILMQMHNLMKKDMLFIMK